MTTCSERSSPLEITAPRLYVGAWFEGLPALERGLNSGGEVLVELPGLPAGRYEVRIFRIMGTPEPLRDLIVNGIQDVDWTLDLR